jgi:spermidine/putrescine transport system permease protein
MSTALAPPRLLQRLTTAFVYWVRRRRLAAFILFGPAALFFAATLLLPMLLVVQLSLYHRGDAGIVVPVVSLDNYVRFFSEPVYLTILVNSAVVGLMVCGITVIVAYVPACVLGLTRSSARNILFLLVLVPFWISFIVRTYAWIVMLGSMGAVNGLFQWLGLIDAPIMLLFGRSAVILGLVHALIPFAIVPIYAAIERIDDGILEAAATLGARPWAVFWEVIVPISSPGIIAAAILVFIDATGAFITPQLLGGPRDMMIAQLVQERFLASFDWPFGAAVSIIYLGLSGAAFLLFIYAHDAIRRFV